MLSVVSLLSLVLVGCSCNLLDSLKQKAADKVIEKVTGGSVSISGSDISVSGSDGSLSVNDKNAQELNNYVQIPGWMTFGNDQTAWKTDSNGTISYTVSYSSSKSVNDAEQYWKNFLDTNGYTNVSDYSYSGGATVNGSKDESAQSLYITVSSDSSNKVTVIVIYSREK